ncbi:MAG: acetyl-CoA C-acyltransferase [Rhodanobacteraceae bacterium]|nr:acetyl-CoA C-acyltransferase [Rhodanobacteraceae bacterium]
MTQARRVAILGGSRIPFCRNNTAYFDLGNVGMSIKAVGSLVEKFKLSGVQLGEVALGAVLKHSSDWNIGREVTLSSGLSPLTPGITMQRACGTSLDTSIHIGNKIALGQIEAGIAGGSDTTSDVPIVVGDKLRRRLLNINRAKTLGQRLMMAKEWGITRESQDQLAFESHRKAAAAYERGFFKDLVVPFRGVERDNILRADTTIEKLATLKPAFDRSSGKGTLTAGNSTPLTDGASAVLLGSEAWAQERGLKPLAYLTHSRAAAVDFVAGEGLLMAPTIAVADLLKATGLSLQDFDFYEIHEAFAAQVLCTLKAWESADYCSKRLGLAKPLGAIDPTKLNVVGSSLAFGHPFAATGARIIATAAKLLDEKGGGRALISVCTAGGMGVVAIVER